MRAAIVLALLLPCFSAQAATRFAFVIGNNVGDSEEEVLRWAVEDARRVYSLVTELGGVVEDRAILLVEANARRVHLELARLRGQVEEANRHGYRTELLLFYSGHGDAESLHLGSERLRLAELGKELQAIPTAATITIIDACRSGRLKRGRGKGAVHGPAFDISLARDAGPAGRVTITSAGSDEVAQESDELRGSFFTHHMLSGLRGAADSDNDGEVTLAELYRYAYNHTLAFSHGETAAVQHPEMHLSLQGEGEIVMTVLNRASSTMTLSGELEGDILVVDDRSSRVVAEVRKPSGAPCSLAMPSGRYRIQLRRAGRVYAGEVALDWGGRREVGVTSLKEQPLVAAIEKGSALDPAPWSIGLLAVAGTASSLGSGIAVGGMAQMERRLLTLPVLAVATLQLSRAHGENDAWKYTHLDIRLGIGATYSFFLGPFQVAAGVSIGPIVVYESAQRTQARRVQAVTGVQTEASAATTGFFVAPMVNARVPLRASLSLAVAFVADTAWLKIDEERRNLFGARGGIGLHYEF